MRLPLLILSATALCSGYQTANLQHNFTIGNAANTMKRLVEQLYDPNDLGSCMGRLVANLGEGWAFTPEEHAAIEEEKAREHEYVKVHTKEEFIALFQSRAPTLYAALVSRGPILENILSKLDPEAEEFLRMLGADLLDMLVSIYGDQEEGVQRALNALREVGTEFNQLSQAARDSMDEVLCLKSLARAFPEAYDKITTIPEQFDQCMAQ